MLFCTVGCEEVSEDEACEEVSEGELPAVSGLVGAVVLELVGVELEESVGATGL